LRPVALQQGVVEVDDIRVAIVGREIVLGFGVLTASSYDDMPYFGWQTLDPIGAKGQIRGDDWRAPCWRDGHEQSETEG